jgi:hypothetical protein
MLLRTRSAAHVIRARERAVAAYPSTVYRLDAAGEVHEVVVEDSEIVALEADRTPVAAVWPQVEQAWESDSFDEIAWWSRQLGRPLSAD